MKDTKQTITTRAEDYSEWYLDVIREAELAEHSPVRGCMVIKPNGYALWEKVQKNLDAEFKKKGVRNAYFPMLIPEKLLKREAEHVEGFAPEVAVVTHAGGSKLDEPLVVRPTSETIMYEVYKDWVESYRDLPLLINQWANVIRWEMRTRLFLRTTEFLWQEGHTVHATFEEADSFAREMLDVYKKFSEEIMAIPVVIGKKSDSERFAGAHSTYTCEAMMQDGKALQYATSHNLGDNFAKAFDIKFLDKDGETKFGWQTSWGLSTRSIGGLIMTHGDDKGLVLPPKMAETPVVIVPIYKEEEATTVLAAAKNLQNILISHSIATHVDERDHMRPGDKFYWWEKRGTPVRIELGPKDIAGEQVVAVRRDTGEKMTISWNGLESEIESLLETIQVQMFEKAKTRLTENTVIVDSWEDFVKSIEEGKFVLAHWDGTPETEKLIKTELNVTTRCIPFDVKQEEGICVKTGKPSKGRIMFARSY